MRSVNLFVLVLICTVSASAADYDAKEILQLIVDSRDDGKSDTIALIGLFLVVAMGTGFTIYKALLIKLEAYMREKILESEARSLIDLGLEYYITFEDVRNINPAISSVSLAHAANQTELATKNLRKLDKTNHLEMVNTLMAVSLTNAAYYHAERFKLINDFHLTGGKSVNEIAKKAVQLAEESTFYVEVAERNRVSNKDAKWWNLVESRLNALSRCDEEFNLENAKTKLDRMFADDGIPSSWKTEIKQDWSDRIDFDLGITRAKILSQTGL